MLVPVKEFEPHVDQCFCFLGATFDPFGAPLKPSGQDLLGSFLNTSSASSDPFLQPTRSPSPTVHGEEVFYVVFSAT